MKYAYRLARPCTHSHDTNPRCPHALHQYYDVVEIDNHDGRETVLAADVRLEPARRIVQALSREQWYDRVIERETLTEAECAL